MGAAFTALQCMNSIIPLSSRIKSNNTLLHGLSIIWHFNSSLLAMHKMYVLGDSVVEGTTSTQEPMMEPVQIEDLVSQFLELMMTILSHPKLKKVCEPSLLDIVSATLEYMTISPEQVEEWSEDCNLFLSCGDEFWGARSSGSMLLDTIVEVYGPKGLQTISTAVQTKIGEAEAAYCNKDDLYWRHMESGILAVGDLSEYLKEKRNKSFLDGDQIALNPNLLLPAVFQNDKFNQTSTPLLLARLFWYSGKFASHLSTSTRRRVLECISRCLVAPGLKPPIYGGIFQAMAPMIMHCEPVEVVSISQHLMPHLCEMLRNATEETLHLLLVTIDAIIQKDQGASMSSMRAVIPIVMRIWVDNFNDPLVGEDSFALLKTIASAPHGFDEMKTAAMPTVKAILESQGTMPLLTSNAINLLVAIMSTNLKDEVSTVVREFGPVCLQVLQKSDDDEVIASTSAFLRTALQIGGMESFSWYSTPPETALAMYLQVFQHLTNPEMSDRACRYAGGLLLEILRAAPGEWVRLCFQSNVICHEAFKAFI